MKLTDEDFRRHYESLPDASLLALNRDELNEVARACYDKETARRGLHGTTPASTHLTASTEEPLLEAEEPVAVAGFAHLGAAEQARATLRAANIPCYLENEHNLWASDATLRGIRVMVPASYLDAASELLDDLAEVAE